MITQESSTNSSVTAWRCLFHSSLIEVMLKYVSSIRNLNILLWPKDLTGKGWIHVFADQIGSCGLSSALASIHFQSQQTNEVSIVSLYIIYLVPRPVIGGKTARYSTQVASFLVGHPFQLFIRRSFQVVRNGKQPTFFCDGAKLHCKRVPQMASWVCDRNFNAMPCLGETTWQGINPLQTS